MDTVNKFREIYVALICGSLDISPMTKSKQWLLKLNSQVNTKYFQ